MSSDSHSSSSPESPLSHDSPTAHSSEHREETAGSRPPLAQSQPGQQAQSADPAGHQPATGEPRHEPPRRIRIGSQRSVEEIAKVRAHEGAGAPPAAAPQPATPPQQAAQPPQAEQAPALPREPQAPPAAAEQEAKPAGRPQRQPREEAEPRKRGRAAARAPLPELPQKKVEPPSKRHLSPELEAELDEALGGMSLDELVGGQTAGVASPEVEPDARHRGRVVSVHREDVFIDFGQRNQGLLSLKQFPEPPAPGTWVDVIVTGFDPEEGLYQLTMPGAAQSVADWSDLAEGAVVEARVTGENKGGLEVEVNNIRGFIPVSQIALYRVEDLAQFVGERMLCIVTEANPERRNLVLSRRALLEREQEQARQKLMNELAVGQVREGVVRSLRDFGAFVDLGGVDGLLHVSQLSWARVKHPSEVLELGQRVTVKIQKIDPETGKISLAMKELSESPWTNIASKYPVRGKVTGRVSKVMDFGAFVELEPGVEGLVHISELAHQRVWRTSDVVQEGQEVEAQVLSIDEEKQRISLSIKAVQARPTTKKEEPEPPEPPEEEVRPQPKRSAPLKGGLGHGAGGEKFGLKW